MTKAQLIEKLVDKGFLRSAAMEVIETAITIIAQTLSEGESVNLRGLATFKIKQVAAKPARNIRQGKPILIPPHKIVKVTLSEKIKRTLRMQSTAKTK